jgi:hypothetical protein
MAPRAAKRRTIGNRHYAIHGKGKCRASMDQPQPKLTSQKWFLSCHNSLLPHLPRDVAKATPRRSHLENQNTGKSSRKCLMTSQVHAQAMNPSLQSVGTNWGQRCPCKLTATTMQSQCRSPSIPSPERTCNAVAVANATLKKYWSVRFESYRGSLIVLQGLAHRCRELL